MNISPRMKKNTACVLLALGEMFFAGVFLICCSAGVFTMGVFALLDAAVALCYLYLILDYIRLLDQQIETDRSLQMENAFLRMQKEQEAQDRDAYVDIADMLTRRAPNTSSQNRNSF